ncbi:MAG TPA: hypothetical protein VE224_03735 [Pseudolabrys sp.]|nr:hypothetical protein [Pseudolabrys sp.]
MSAVSYGENYVAPAVKAAPRKKNWAARVLGHLIEARMQQAAERTARIERSLGLTATDFMQRHHLPAE